jgi:lipopolysaccharide transport system permease protein
VGVGLNLWFFMTPIMYPPSVVSEDYRFLYDLNPNARFINAYRGYLFDGTLPSVENLAFGLVVALVSLTAGFYLFRRLEPGFADRI